MPSKVNKAATPVARDLSVIGIRRPPWLDDILVPWRICAQRILVVADGLDFNESNGFGLTRFLLALALHAAEDRLAVLVGQVDALIIAAIERDANSVKDYDVAGATRLAVLKLVGYTEAVHVLADRLTPTASIVLFGGLAMMRPYPGSTTVTTVNGGVSAMVRTLASELAPVRVNAVHPGIVGDSPAWEDKDLSMVIARTPIGRTVTMDEIVGATLFLLDNGGVNGQNLMVEGGVLVR